jgi:hypothetical protein
MYVVSSDRSTMLISGDRCVHGPAYDRPSGFKRTHVILGGGYGAIGFRVLKRKP